MGVKGLWRLLLPIGRRISIETLEGQVLAIDASIWLTQFLSAMRDPDTGKVRPAAHLIGFLRRLAKLRFHGIRPVLVFDGATPEIKLRELRQRRQRREQFASTGEEAMQRLAKRLVAEQLKKRKGGSKAGGGAFAPGFQLAAEEGGTKETIDTESKAINSADETNGDSEQAILEEVRDLEKEWQEKPNVEAENDWDKPIVQVESDDEDESEYQDSFFAAHAQDEDFIVNRISSLPSQMRKDAIEDAKRQQRMRSRKEFMPVAGQPEEYSQAQLRNFLRSSRLNQKIVEMVKESVGDDNELGERVASDASRRIIFTKDNDETKLATHDWKRLMKQSPRASSDEDDEFEWQDGDENGKSKGGQYTHQRNTQNEAESTIKIQPSKKVLAIRDSDTEEEEEEGGFLKTNEPTTSRASVIDLDNEGDDESAGEGFLPGSGANGGFQSCTVDSRRTQELEDEMLAQAIQESEAAARTTDDIERYDTPTEDDAAAGLQENVPEQHAESSTDEASVDWEDGEEATMANIASPGQGQRPADPILMQGDDDGQRKTRLFNMNAMSTLGSANSVSQTGNREQENSRPPDSSLVAAMAGKSVDGNEELDRREVNVKSGSQQPFDDSADDEWASEVAHSDKNSQALAHAQETAANLTNWAGRAFQRAIAQHEEQVGGHAHLHNLEDDSGSDDTDRHLLPSHSGSPELQSRQEAKLDSDDTHVAGERQDSTSLPSMDPLQDLSVLWQDREDAMAGERRQQESQMDPVTDEMKADIVQLIQLFGIPYVDAPAEAEAQCAMLEELGLVDGIVTEDSDVFVFGGRNVYKNIFDDQKYVEVYSAKDAQRDLALERNHMVALAMLMGGDYTEGVKGVGIVNGMEILQAFDMSKNVKDGLSRFREWLDGFDPSDVLQRNEESESLSPKQRFHIKHRSARTRWIAPKYFPADNVLNAYLNPVVDKSRRPFTWGVPDLDNLLIFCRDKLGFDANDTKNLIGPVLQRLKSSSRQTHMESFFMKYEDNIKFASVKSKRLQQVFQDIHKGTSAEVADEDEPCKKDASLSSQNDDPTQRPAQKRRKRHPKTS